MLSGYLDRTWYLWSWINIEIHQEQLKLHFQFVCVHSLKFQHIILCNYVPAFWKDTIYGLEWCCDGLKTRAGQDPLANQLIQLEKWEKLFCLLVWGVGLNFCYFCRVQSLLLMGLCTPKICLTVPTAPIGKQLQSKLKWQKKTSSSCVIFCLSSDPLRERAKQHVEPKEKPTTTFTQAENEQGTQGTICSPWLQWTGQGLKMQQG